MVLVEVLLDRTWTCPSAQLGVEMAWQVLESYLLGRVVSTLIDQMGHGAMLIYREQKACWDHRVQVLAGQWVRPVSREVEVQIVQTGTLLLRSSCWEVQEQHAEL